MTNVAVDYTLLSGCVDEECGFHRAVHITQVGDIGCRRHAAFGHAAVTVSSVSVLCINEAIQNHSIIVFSLHKKDGIFVIVLVEGIWAMGVMSGFHLYVVSDGMKGAVRVFQHVRACVWGELPSKRLTLRVASHVVWVS